MSTDPSPDRRSDRERPALSLASASPLDVVDVAEFGERLRAAVREAMQIADDTLDVVLSTMLAGGHLLLEDRPGVGKTQLARTLAGSVDGRFGRVQATVDLLPTDILGATIWHAGTETFEFHPGPVFANVVLVDELNRATPKTQSGLLEAMQELQVTVDGRTHPLERPFMVIATQNPNVGYDGTYRLPPAQLDRFLARVSLGYPTNAQEIALLREPPSGGVTRAGTLRELLAAQGQVEEVRASEALLGYVVGVLEATRAHPLSETGASPRAGLQLLGAARARAALQGRDFVLPDDVQVLAESVLAHRIEPVAAAALDAPLEIVADALNDVPGAVIRSAALAVAPALLMLAAAALGSLALFGLALALITLYVGIAVTLARAERQLTVVRTIDRGDVQEGRPVTVHFEVGGLHALPVRVEVLGPGGQWHALESGSGSVPFVIDRPGAHVLGPSPLLLRDDLGLFSRLTLGGRPESLLVLPEPAPPPARLRAGGALVAADPEPDGLRPYAPGTPMSRVHWASAARGRELQERHFTSGRDRLPLVVVDTVGAEGASLDWVARSAAGIVLALARAGGCRVLLPGDRVPTTLDDIGGWPALHRRLAALEPGAPAPLTALGDRDVLHVRAASAPATLDPRGALPPGVIALPDWERRHAPARAAA